VKENIQDAFVLAIVLGLIYAIIYNI